MKALFTLQPAHSHLHPLVALADALRRAGHEVLFATADGFRATVERAGFASAAAGIDWRVSDGERTFPELGRRTGEALNRYWFCDVLCGATPAPMARDLAPLLERVAPDLLIHDLYELGGPLAAERAGIPYATHAFGHYTPRARMAALVGKELARARAAVGLTDDDALDWLYRDLYLDFVPSSFQRVPVELEVAHALRPAALDHLGHGAPPAWLDELGSGPTAYVTLGTVFNRAPLLFRTLVQGLRSLCRNIVVTVGDEQDPAALGLTGLGVRVVRYVPQSQLLPRCDLVVTHGGFNTVMGALAHGVPLLCVPLQADQPHNAACVARLGLGLSLDAPTGESVFAAARRLCAEPEWRARTTQFRATLDALPEVDHAVALCERLAVEKRPIRLD